MVKNNLHKSQHENRDAFHAKHTFFKLLGVVLGGQSGSEETSLDYLSNLEYHHEIVEDVSVLEELCMVLENLDRDVPI